MLHMQVDLVEALGAETLLYLSNGQGLHLVLRQSARSGLHSGQSVGIDLQFDCAHYFDAQGRALRQGAVSV
jgi:multiple sugar transport system ATP-binding protein